MKPAPFTLHLPRTLPETLQLLATQSNARVIAGGQSLMPMLNMRLAMPDNLIDLNGVAGLSGIQQEGDDIVLGAMTRQRDIEFSNLVAEKLPLMRAAVLNVGHRQTRNRGTLGGSLCHMDPSAELPAVCMIMDARLIIESAGGRREIPVAGFPQGFMSTCVQPDEMLTQIRITPWRQGHGWHFLEFARRHGDFAVVSAAALIERESSGVISRAALVLGGVGAGPVRLPLAESILAGSTGDSAAIQAAADEAEKYDALDDPAYPSWYRQRLAKKLLYRAIESALAKAGSHQGVL